jgi:hypothetical protein
MAMRLNNLVTTMMGAMAMVAGCAGGGHALTTAGAVSPEVGRCGRWIVGASAAAADQRIVMLGGGLGTAEGARFVGELACQLAKVRPVVVALPWPRQLASQLNLFIGGSTSAEAKLRGHALWTTKEVVSAGLASQAMWELLVQLRSWRAAGQELKVVPFGPEFSEGEDGGYDRNYPGHERYQQTYALGEALRKNGDALFLLWTEAGAASRTFKVGNEPSLAAALAGESSAKLATFALEAPPSAAAWSMERRQAKEKEGDGYDGVFRLGATTASGPLPAAP